MNINEAIEILERDATRGHSELYQEMIEAEKLAIEALKRIRNSRIGYDPSGGHKLPGETEEGGDTCKHILPHRSKS